MVVDMYTFEVLGGETNKKGKSDWPHVLQVLVSKQEAMRIIADLAHQCHTHAADDKMLVEFVRCGKLSEG